MAQNSFALIFLLVLAAGAISLLLTVRESWGRVVTALVGAHSHDMAPKVYSTTVRPAAEVPWVAQRLVLHDLDEELPASPSVFTGWLLPHNPQRAGRQLAFPFLESTAA